MGQQALWAITIVPLMFATTARAAMEMPPRGGPPGPVFDRFDRNHDGVIDRGEFERLIQAHHDRRGPMFAGRPPGGPGREPGDGRQLLRERRRDGSCERFPNCPMRDGDGGQRREMGRVGPPDGGQGFGMHQGRMRMPPSGPPMGPGPCMQFFRQRMGAAFGRFDHNRDGAIEHGEFPGRDDRFHRMDRDGDGRIERREMRETMRERLLERRRGPEGREYDAPPPPHDDEEE